MELMFDDTKEKALLVISSGSKTLLTKRARTLKELLRFVHDNTKQDNVRESILEVLKAYKFMIGSKTTIKIKDL